MKKVNDEQVNDLCEFLDNFLGDMIEKLERCKSENIHETTDEDIDIINHICFDRMLHGSNITLH